MSLLIPHYLPLTKYEFNHLSFACFLNVCTQTLKHFIYTHTHTHTHTHIYYWKVDTHIHNLESIEGKWGKSGLAHIMYSFMKAITPVTFLAVSYICIKVWVHRKFLLCGHICTSFLLQKLKWTLAKMLF